MKSVILCVDSDKPATFLESRTYTFHKTMNPIYLILRHLSSAILKLHTTQTADILKVIIKNPNARIDVMQSTALQLKIDENHTPDCVCRAVSWEQQLALRGDTEHVSSAAKNPDRFESFAENDPILQNHLHKECYLHLTSDSKWYFGYYCMALMWFVIVLSVKSRNHSIFLWWLTKCLAIMLALCVMCMDECKKSLSNLWNFPGLEIKT